MWVMSSVVTRQRDEVETSTANGSSRDFSTPSRSPPDGVIGTSVEMTESSKNMLYDASKMADDHTESQLNRPLAVALLAT